MATTPFAALQEEEPKPAGDAKLCSSCGKTKPNKVCLCPCQRCAHSCCVRVDGAQTRAERVGSQAFSKKQWVASARVRKCAHCVAASEAASGGSVPAHSAGKAAKEDAAGAEPAAPASALSSSMCWICYDDDPALGGLVAPCKCSGTVAYGRHHVVVLRPLLSVQDTVLCNVAYANAVASSVGEPRSEKRARRPQVPNRSCCRDWGTDV